ncbi:MAG: filamentous hemagglutinin N-terminal domain-containing protein, partial [Burkholderiales bacterium]|nr:filamentous hemagglutinin N-terminal domain-containing protein [Burkholderiales bacterium]
MPAQSNRSLRRRALVLALAAAFPFGAVANPLDPTVVSGNAAFESNGSTLAITNSNGAIIHWQSFSIGNGETTRFIQPSVDSQVLNRVMGQDPSTILGTLQSNGQVFLINPNGIAFGAHAVVDVAGLVASTLNLSNADFLAGRYSFAGNGAPGGIRNDGLLQALAGGRILLVAPDIANHGVITVPGGDVILAAGHSVQMIDTHRPDVQVQVTAANDSAVNLGRITSGHIGIYGAAIRQEGTVSATTAAVGENGTVVFRAASTLQAGANSITEARGQNGGSIDVAAPVAWLDGTIRADGDAGGQVRVAADAIVQSGTISARGLAGDGGSIDLGTSGNLLQTATARLLASGAAQGGDIRVVSTDGQVYSSAGFDASSGNGIGGRIAVGGDRVVIAGASLDASGALGGGSVLVGGGFRGADPTLANSTYTRVTTGSVLRADATSNGAGGTVAIWSDGDTRYQGAASVRGAGTAQPGGIVEVSGKDSLRYGGTVELSPGAGGAPGSLLLDPKTIIIDNVGGATGYVIVADFDDPNPTAGAQFGSYWTTSFFGNGNVLVRVPDADIGALDAAGAIYLFSSTGVLQATATGAASNDRVGDGSIYVLNNGNFLLLNGSWAGGRGAVTLGNPTTLLGSPSSVISSANSLVGSSTSDRIGDLFPFFMSNGNYVLLSDAWNGNRGAYTFGTPTSLATGVVSSANSLVGTTPDDFSSRIFRELSGVNMYAIFARGYDNGGVVDAGAITFGNKSTGLTGTVNASNSLIGAAAGDQFGFSEFELDSLGGTRYLFANSRWNGGRGIVTWLDLASALPGVLSSSNSLVGSAAGDNIGSDFRVLSDKYIVIAPNWNNGRGAVAMGDVNTGLTGVVTSSNSLIGATDGDRIGDVVVLLNNGHYVVGSPEATINGIAAAGAVVWGDGVNGTVGVVDDTNSLHGSHAGDRVGNVISALDNGNYVVESPDWNGTAGAVTFVQGGDGHFRVGGGLVTAGIVSADNSVVGSVAGSRVGSGGILPVVFEDAYLVLSPLWTDTGAAPEKGALTWVNANDGTIDNGASFGGVVADTNSLVGANAHDMIGHANFNGPVQQI